MNITVTPIDLSNSVPVKAFTFGLLLLIVLGAFGCDIRDASERDQLYLVSAREVPTYNLRKPVQKFFLPYILEEISALTYYKDDVLACVEDESGEIYFYDLKTKEVVREIRFSGPGDYEGLSIVDDVAYVVKSNGTIYRFIIPEDPDITRVERETIKTPLSSKNDVEGLGYDAATGKLLLATKEDGRLDDDLEKIGKAVYAFDPDSNVMDPKPIFTVSRAKIKAFLEKHLDNDYEDKRLLFKTSGISVHPIDQRYYLIASTGKLMLIINREGEIEESYPIIPRLLTQPEGICFAPNGDMFISSEGEGDRGYILKFSMN